MNIVRRLERGSGQGFTIVELLIVIVVIAILAAITIVAFSGVQNRANDSAVQADLRNAASILGQEKAINGTYPSTLTAAMGLKFSRNSYGADYQGYNVRYCYNSATDEYLLYVNSKSGNYFKYAPSGGGLQSATATYGWGVCQQIGLVNTNPVSNGYTPSGWSAWVN